MWYSCLRILSPLSPESLWLRPAGYLIALSLKKTFALFDSQSTFIAIVIRRIPWPYRLVALSDFSQTYARTSSRTKNATRQIGNSNWESGSHQVASWTRTSTCLSRCKLHSVCSSLVNHINRLELCTPLSLDFTLQRSEPSGSRQPRDLFELISIDLIHR